MVDQTDIYRAYNFTLQIGTGTEAGYFTEVSGMSIDIEKIVYREGGALPTVRNLPGCVTHGDVTLKWGMTDTRDLWDWLMETAAGRIETRAVSIKLKSNDGQTDQAVWDLEAAWPASWRGTQLNALGQEVAIETLTLTHQGFTRSK